MRVIADTGPLIALERIGHLSLLKRLYQTVWMPPAVRGELLRGSRVLGWPDPMRGTPWIRVSRQALGVSAHLLRTNLGAGESEALALALQSRPSLLLLDDLAARTTAHALGLRYTGTLGVLLKAKTAGLIPAVRPLLDQFPQRGFHLSDALSREVLALANE